MMEVNRARRLANGEFSSSKVDGTSDEAEALQLPGFFSQVATLISRRWRIFFRDRGQVFL
jgi:hypothetical protein